MLSVDVELAWGLVPRGKIDKPQLKEVEKVRKILDPLLDLIRYYEIPVTWAIVGHLFLDRCTCSNPPHPDMPRPNYTWFKGDWYRFDPCSNIRDAPHWYGRDVVEEILEFSKDSPADQEIACHSFSHQLFGDPGCSSELAEAEIDKCTEIMKGFGVCPKTFSFPVGSVGHLNLLKEKGFVAFCSSIPRLVNGSRLEKSVENVFSKYVGLGIEFLTYYFLLPPPVVTPKEVFPGLWELPNSMCFNKKRGVPISLVVLRAKKGISRTVKEGKCFHMFTHLHNFGLDSTSIFCAFEDVLSFADKERSKGTLQVANVKQYVEIVKQSNFPDYGYHESC